MDCRDLIIVSGIDRISRNTSEIIEIFGYFRELGIILLSMTFEEFETEVQQTGSRYFALSSDINNVAIYSRMSRPLINGKPNSGTSINDQVKVSYLSFLIACCANPLLKMAIDESTIEKQNEKVEEKLYDNDHGIKVTIEEESDDEEESEDEKEKEKKIYLPRCFFKFICQDVINLFKEICLSKQISA
ncbi:hypothetical protein PPL_08340 [Heterostelium album PN500]|uniref:Resolvase/invertase-type recombinase catalytic domain-containing protein n=1 Tax=Heterostelium pallidum (strain ATCC 26659 / Pp 5 / PN500) TaxID=670386 RepID=D3BHX2_HETP5|nr:hypothetical protein PPL_08340 [Heterostelium album PN500]EFA78872.1 hypothetical protein PPL_08340 [Heterostelium album PN500]|eukprot:XP_020430996.1 hypothetical protein PPL_08340 [Heterostelium album PN500]